jgi:hypothetical protein
MSSVVTTREFGVKNPKDEMLLLRDPGMIGMGVLWLMSDGNADIHD